MEAAVTQPVATEVAVTEPEPIEAAVEAAVTQPEPTEVAAMEPVPTEVVVTEPEPIEAAGTKTKSAATKMMSATQAHGRHRISIFLNT